jgi:hypothetical protein
MMDHFDQIDEQDEEDDIQRRGIDNSPANEGRSMENWQGANPQRSGTNLHDSEMPSEDIVDRVKGSKHDDNLVDDGENDASEDDYEDDFD